MVAESVQNNRLSVVNWGNGKAYFFKGNQYIRYDIAANKADAGYPLPIKNNWPGLEAFADGIDAAVNWDNGKAYLFKGNQYIRFDIAADRADPGYPYTINNRTWPGLDAFFGGIDAAVNWRNGKVYLFKGNQYIRFDIAADRADPGYPKPIIDNWPGLTFWKQEEIPLNPAEQTTGEFQVPINSLTGIEFTNKLAKDSSYKFTPSGTWKTPSDTQERTAAGLKGFPPDRQPFYIEELKKYQQHLKYPNNTYLALVAVNKTTGVVTEVTQETTIVLKAGEALTFLVNYFPTEYKNNTGTLTVKWSAT